MTDVKNRNLFHRSTQNTETHPNWKLQSTLHSESYSEDYFSVQ